MHLRQTLNAAVRRLTADGVPSPRMNAELLIMFTLDCNRAYLYAHPERELTAGELQRYNEYISRRATGVPAQYITGHQEFWGLDFIVTPAVLIPRPETEHVVETVLALVGRQSSREGSFNHEEHEGTQRDKRRGTASCAIVDVGTGTGAIALALAKELPRAEIHATDVSPAALEIARANATRHELSSRIRFHQTDLLTGLEGEFDFVVSNPPYVGESEEDSVQLEVRKFEPRNAVFAGPTGLETIERLIPQARTVLKPGGWLVCEISGTIATRVQQLLSGWADVIITNDLQGIARVAHARK